MARRTTEYKAVESFLASVYDVAPQGQYKNTHTTHLQAENYSVHYGSCISILMMIILYFLCKEVFGECINPHS